MLKGDAPLRLPFLLQHSSFNIQHFFLCFPPRLAFPPVDGDRQWHREARTIIQYSGASAADFNRLPIAGKNIPTGFAAA